MTSPHHDTSVSFPRCTYLDTFKKFFLKVETLSHFPECTTTIYRWVSEEWIDGVCIHTYSDSTLVWLLVQNCSLYLRQSKFFFFYSTVSRSVFCDITPSSPLKVNQLQSGFLLGLLWNPEDGDNLFIWNFGWLSADYTVLYPWRYTSS